MILTWCCSFLVSISLILSPISYSIAQEEAPVIIAEKPKEIDLSKDPERLMELLTSNASMEKLEEEVQIELAKALFGEEGLCRNHQMKSPTDPIFANWVFIVEQYKEEEEEKKEKKDAEKEPELVSVARFQYDKLTDVEFDSETRVWNYQGASYPISEVAKIHLLDCSSFAPAELPMQSFRQELTQISNMLAYIENHKDPKPFGACVQDTLTHLSPLTNMTLECVGDFAMGAVDNVNVLLHAAKKATNAAVSLRDAETRAKAAKATGRFFSGVMDWIWGGVKSTRDLFGDNDGNGGNVASILTSKVVKTAGRAGDYVWDIAANQYGCLEWEGHPFISECKVPYMGEYASCAEKISIVCGMAGFVAGEGATLAILGRGVRLVNTGYNAGKKAASAMVRAVPYSSYAIHYVRQTVGIFKTLFGNGFRFISSKISLKSLRVAKTADKAEDAAELSHSMRLSVNAFRHAVLTPGRVVLSAPYLPINWITRSFSNLRSYLNASLAFGLGGRYGQRSALHALKKKKLAKVDAKIEKAKEEMALILEMNRRSQRQSYGVRVRQVQLEAQIQRLQAQRQVALGELWRAEIAVLKSLPRAEQFKNIRMAALTLEAAEQDRTLLASNIWSVPEERLIGLAESYHQTYQMGFRWKPGFSSLSPAKKAKRIKGAIRESFTKPREGILWRVASPEARQFIHENLDEIVEGIYARIASNPSVETIRPRINYLDPKKYKKNAELRISNVDEVVDDTFDLSGTDFRYLNEAWVDNNVYPVRLLLERTVQTMAETGMSFDDLLAASPLYQRWRQIRSSTDGLSDATQALEVHINSRHYQALANDYTFRLAAYEFIKWKERTDAVYYFVGPDALLKFLESNQAGLSSGNEATGVGSSVLRRRVEGSSNTADKLSK